MWLHTASAPLPDEPKLHDKFDCFFHRIDKDSCNEAAADTPRPIGRGFLDRSKNLPASSRLP